MVKTVSFSLSTRGYCDLKDITSEIGDAVTRSGLQEGIVTVFVPGSTAGITTLEYESGAVEDFKEAVEKWIPSDIPYRHNERWGDGNGFSHVRSAMVGPSLTVPFQGGKPLLGTWQQVVLADFDNRPRKRTVILQILGE